MGYCPNHSVVVSGVIIDEIAADPLLPSRKPRRLISIADERGYLLSYSR